MRLEPGIPLKLHTFHAHDPLLLKVWIDGETYRRALLSGSCEIRQPPPGYIGDEIVVVLPLRHATQKAQNVSLQVTVREDGEGVCAVEIFAPHCLHNHSSLPIQVHHHTGIGGAVVDAFAHDKRPHLFSFWQGDARARLSARPQGARHDLGSARDLSLAFGRGSSTEGARSAGGARESDGVRTETMGGDSSVPRPEYSSDARRKKLLRDKVKRGMKRIAKEVASGATVLNMSRVIRIDVLGAEMGVTVPCSGGYVAELAVSVEARSSKSSALIVRDRIVFVNTEGTGLEFDWREVLDAEFMGKSQFAALTLKPNGEHVALKWRGSQPERLMAIRPGGGLHAWCMPFSPFSPGGFFLKFRPATAHDGTPSLYMRLTISVSGSQHILTLHPPDERLGIMLPYTVTNASSQLLAFRQAGCKHWDLLGAGESTPYALDIIDAGDDEKREAVRKLELRVRDSHGGMRASASSQISKLEAARELKLEPGSLEEARPGPSGSSATLPPLETVLFSVGCALHYGLDDPSMDGFATSTAARGWLVASANFITFVEMDEAAFFDDDDDNVVENMCSMLSCTAGKGNNRRHRLSWAAASAAEAGISDLSALAARMGGEMTLDEARASAAGGVHLTHNDERWLGMDALPLGLEQLEEVRTDGNGYTVWLCSKRGGRLALTALRDAAQTSHRLQAHVTAHRDARHTANLAQLMKERIARQAMSATLVASEWRSKKKTGGGEAFTHVGQARRRSAEMERRSLSQKEGGESAAKSNWEQMPLRMIGSAVHKSGSIVQKGGAAVQTITPMPVTTAVTTTASTANAAAEKLQAAARGRKVRSDARMGGSRSAQPRKGTAIDLPELAEAAGRGELQLVEMLLQRNACVDSYGADGSHTALQLAILGGRQEMIWKLLQAGADVEKASYDGWEQTALHIAASRDSVRSVNKLLMAGANPHAKRGGDGKTPRECAPPPERRVMHTLSHAEQSWEARGSKKRQMCALVDAAHHGDLRKVIRLLEWQADPDSFSPGSGLAAIHEACHRGDVETLAALLQAGADPNLSERLNFHGHVGMRPLHFAARKGWTRCLKLLLGAHANPMLTDVKCALPLHYCGDGARAARELLLRTAMAASREGDGLTRAERRKLHAMEKTVADFTLKLRVTTHGPVRDLRVEDWVDAKPDEPEHSSAPPSRDASPQGRRRGSSTEPGRRPSISASSSSSAPTVTHTIYLERVGLAIIDEEPREIIYLSLVGLHAVSEKKLDGSLSGGVEIDQLQIDSTIDKTEFPVLLATAEAVKHSHKRPGVKLMRRRMRLLHRKRFKVDGDAKRCFMLHVDHMQDWGGSQGAVRCFGSVFISMMPLYLRIEQNLLARFIRLAATLGTDSTEMNESIQLALGEAGLASRESSDARSELKQRDAASKSIGSTSEIYIKRLELQPVQLFITAQMAEMPDDPALEAYSVQHNQSLSVLAALVSVRDWQLHLPVLTLSEIFESARSILSRCVSHYSVAIAMALYRLVLSLDKFGNVGGMIGDITGSVKSFTSESQKGVLGVVSGTGQLIGGVTGGVGSWGVSMMGGGLRMVSTSTAYLAFDPHYLHVRGRAMATRASGTFDGMRLGASVIKEGLVSAALGVVKEPLRGGRSEGVVGGMTGAGRGLLGSLAKVMSGTTFLISKTAEGVTADLKKLTPSSKSIERRLLMRVRQPRDVGRSGVLLPYPRTQSGADGTGDDEEGDDSGEDELDILAQQALAGPGARNVGSGADGDDEDLDEASEVGI